MAGSTLSLVDGGASSKLSAPSLVGRAVGDGGEGTGGSFQGQQEDLTSKVIIKTSVKSMAVVASTSAEGASAATSGRSTLAQISAAAVASGKATAATAAQEAEAARRAEVRQKFLEQGSSKDVKDRSNKSNQSFKMQKGFVEVQHISTIEQQIKKLQVCENCAGCVESVCRY